MKDKEMKKGTYVSRAVYAKLQAENHRLLNDIKDMVMSKDGADGYTWCKWRKHFKEQNQFNNMLRELIKPNSNGKLER